jgi:hypothetical protein
MEASVEAMLDLWSAALREGKAQMQPLFKHPGVADSAFAYIDGLDLLQLSGERVGNCLVSPSN